MGITSKNTFRLKPNLFVITKSKATMGGAFSDTKLVWKTEDAGLKQADLEFVSKYFLATALEQLQASRGALLPTQASTNCGPYRPLPKQCNPWQKDPRKKDFCRAHLEEAEPEVPRPQPMPQPMPRPQPMPMPQPMPQPMPMPMPMPQPNSGYGGQMPYGQEPGYGGQMPYGQEPGYGGQMPYGEEEEDDSYGGMMPYGEEEEDDSYENDSNDKPRKKK